MNTKKMRKLFTSLAMAIFFPLILSAQFGLRAGYIQGEAEQWRISSPAAITEAPGMGWQMGIDYWFRLPKLRIEFTPELNYASQSLNIVDGPELQTDWFSFFFHTNIYLLDLANDCNCPTFSKQNDFFAKGFFLQISPGVSMPLFRNNLPTSNANPSIGKLSPNLGAGLGLDLGISDLVTLSPQIGLRYYPELEWANAFPDQGLDQSFSIQDRSSSLWQWQAALRIGIRLDPQ